jgi:hypothetical protein
MEFTVKIDEAGFTGEVKVNFPTRAEKMKLLQELKAMGYGKDEGDDLDDSKIALATRMGEVVDERLLSIDVTHIESGVRIEDKGYLDVYSEGNEIVGILTRTLLGGVSLGKDKS